MGIFVDAVFLKMRYIWHSFISNLWGGKWWEIPEVGDEQKEETGRSEEWEAFKGTRNEQPQIPRVVAFWEVYGYTGTPVNFHEDRNAFAQMQILNLEWYIYIYNDLTII